MVSWSPSVNNWSFRLVEHEHVEEYINKGSLELMSSNFRCRCGVQIICETT